MKKGLIAVGSFLLLLIAMAFGKVIGKSAFSLTKPTQADFDRELIRGFELAVAKVNVSAPSMIDPETRMDRATVGPGAKVVYHYTFVNYSASDIDPSIITSEVRAQTKAAVCAAQEMKLSLQYGGFYEYTYSGNDGLPIAKFQFDYTDCGYTRIYP